ncbi:MAG: hypothetical protein RLZZ292_3738 [Bacteroidota bacterium]|jgi:hypothetical protein
MIKLEYAPQPTELNATWQTTQTSLFKTTGKAVWKVAFIEKALLASSFQKCAYSESLLGEEGKYMEIDHFYCKSLFPDKVVEWENLLPSNKKCNIVKDDHNVETEPIINPYKDNPKDHFYLQRV